MREPAIEQFQTETRQPESRNVISDFEKSPKCDRPNSAAKNMPPLVSVIIPSFNCAQYLADAVRSVFGQTYSALECVVIDDGSTDHTSDVLEELLTHYPLLKVAKKVNGGLSSARNMGLRLCSGSYLSFLDADDVLLPDKIEPQVKVFNANPEVDLVYGDYLIASEKLDALAVFVAEMPRELDPFDAFCFRNWFGPMVPLIRRRLSDKIGEFDEQLAAAEDWDYWIRCAKIARIAYLPGPVALYRQHGCQMSKNYSRMRNACIQVANKNFRWNWKKLKMAMALIELTHAKQLWRDKRRVASSAALMRYVIGGLCGLHFGCIVSQLEALRQSQLKPVVRAK